MKKNNLYAAFFMSVVALTACNDEMHEIVQSGDNLIVEASMGIESRTSLKDDFSGTVIWSPNDQIYLFGGKSNATMTLKSGANTTRATFSGTVDGKTSELKTAIYPIPDIKNDKYTFELPATRKYSENSAAPMIGSLSGTHVSFKNLTALVRIPVWSNDKERVLTLTMDGIAGTLAVDIENHTADIVNGTNTVTITIPAGEACYVDIPVPAKEYNGYTVTLDNKEIAKKTDKVELSAQSFCTILTEPKFKVDNSGNVIYSIEHPTHLMWVANQNDSFEGKELKLVNDLDFKNIIYTSIGDKGNGSTPFKGTFNGDNHTIYNLYQSGWEFGYVWGNYGSLGLFSQIDNATVKNLTIEGMESLIEGGDISFIAGSATGTCVFENITIKNSTIATYNNGCGGIIGWSGAGNYTFKNITIEEDVVLAGLWGSFDSSIGGIVGQAERGATYNFENVKINCRLDVYNDCTASYDYYNYRMCGMIIGRCEETTTIDGVNYPDMSKYNVTCNNVTVNYGEWMNYHYCEPTPGLNGGRGMRVEKGYSYDGLPADFDHTQCTINHNALIPFDQLIGGNQLGVKGLKTYDGVTVVYPN